LFDVTPSRALSNCVTIPVAAKSDARCFATEYWADSGASILASGGSIQRIGYDQTLYEEAVRVVILGEQPAEKREMAGMIPKNEEAEGRAEKGKEAQGMEGYKTNKEDLATIVSSDVAFLRARTGRRATAVRAPPRSYTLKRASH
jgi:hypothetical protein